MSGKSDAHGHKKTCGLGGNSVKYHVDAQEKFTACPFESKGNCSSNGVLKSCVRHPENDAFQRCGVPKAGIKFEIKEGVFVTCPNLSQDSCTVTQKACEQKSKQKSNKHSMAY